MSESFPIRFFIVTIALLCGGLSGISAGPERPVEPLERAHAHNDYEHERPLLDALDHGFCSVEADIVLSEGELLVAHHPWLVRKGRDLESLYLKPLAERVRANAGSVYAERTRFILLVDIKRNGEEVYPVLDELLTRYKEMLSAWGDGVRRDGAVTVILSGDRPRALVSADPTRYCAIDGRAGDLGAGASNELVPLVSDNWRNHFKWRGVGEIPDAERRALTEFVDRAHKEGRLLRFWAVPDNKECWQLLYEVGVDLINTDDLAGLAEFMGKLD